MFDALIASAVLMMPSDTTDREWAVNRPDRSVSAVRRASTVPGRWRSYEACVASRESHRNPKARNPRSSAMGTYQFLDRSWRHGLAHMVADRLRDNGLPWVKAKAVRSYLRSHEIARWPATYQTIGFIAVVEAGGAYHWKLAGSPCERFR